MKTSSRSPLPRGYVSLVLVLTSGLLLTALLLYSYKHSLSSQSIETEVQLRLDYGEKEDAILRSIVATAPNRAIRAMRSNSLAAGTVEPLKWETIFSEALTNANTRKSISAEMLTTMGATSAKLGNSGDSTVVTNVASIFSRISGDTATTGFVSSGLNRSLGAGYPAALNCVDSNTIDRDKLYPIISANKTYGSMASGLVGLPTANYPNLNVLKYPKINFGYAKPGDSFVAKRNWWAFNIGLAGNDQALTSLPLSNRQFVLSIYEIPSQLAISASSFMSLGKYESGDAWQNVSIEGNVFAGKAALEGNVALPGLASRRGVDIGTGSTVSGQSFSGNPMAVGVRESYQVTNGSFFPVSQASESGRVAFVPINRGVDFFDRYACATEASDNAVSPNNLWARFGTLTSERKSTWDNYSIGAVQCAMRLDITRRASASNLMPTEMKFQYLKGGVMQTMTIPIGLTVQALPAGFNTTAVAVENGSYTFADYVDVAYGMGSSFYIQRNVKGTVNFNNTVFGDPLVGTVKAGYYGTRFFAEVKAVGTLGGKICVVVYPQRIAAYLAAIGADGPATNNSLAVNVDYQSGIGATYPTKPNIPCTDADYGVVLDECANLSTFTKGFSLVSNLRLYIADDFNTTTTTVPSNYTGTTYYPPCSLFTPEKRYGMSVDPFAVNFTGQVGSVSSDTDAVVRPLDSKNKSGAAMSASKLTVNLKPITHPADIPPITMMNWLILLEEKTNQF